MKYTANPIEVDAFKILEVTPLEGSPKLQLDCSEGRRFYATAEMTSRMTPTKGDYFVVQADNYAYLNPKDVFERKYHPTAAAATA